MRAALAGVLLACCPLAAAAAPAVDDPNLIVEQVTGDLEAPTTMAFYGPDDFFVLEKNTGQVHRVNGGVLAPGVVVDLAVNYCGERGLLGVAVHPEFGAGMNKDWVYLYYTASSGVADENTNCGEARINRLDRFTWDAGLQRLVAPVAEIATFPSYAQNHNGGPLVFGQDGTLYGVIGDLSQNEITENNDASAVLQDSSIVFRLNDDGSVPADNPFSDAGDKHFAYGVRNSFGLAIDPQTGWLWDTENGENVYDEINQLPPGANSGWMDIMGPGPAPAGLAMRTGSVYVEPAYSAFDPPSFTGLAFAGAGSAMGGAYEGDLFVGDFNNGHVYAFDVSPTRDDVVTATEVADNQNQLNAFRIASGFTGGVTDVKEGPDGALYVVAIQLGEVWRLRDSGVVPGHDVAIASLKSPKKVTFKGGVPKLKTLKLALENRGTATETIANQGELDALVDVDIVSLGGACVGMEPATSIQPPKDGFPISWEAGGKLKLGLDVAWQCINDPAPTSKGADHDDFTLEATLDLLGALGATDEDPSNDGCPRAAAGGDKGCGKQDTPFRVDLIEK
jgi:glucose/arabinose dehydrogenase